MIIFKHFSFDAAHFLPNVPKGHKCKEIHGHTYRATIYFEGEVDEEFGWVIDFGDIKKVVNPIIDSLDHHLLNNIEGLSNPTCEVLAKWMWQKIKQEISILSKIELYETLTSGAVYKGD